MKKKIYLLKIPKEYQWKLWTAREKFEKSVRASDFSFREKSKQIQNSFNRHFQFSRGKNAADEGSLSGGRDEYSEGCQTLEQRRLNANIFLITLQVFKL